MDVKYMRLVEQFPLVPIETAKHNGQALLVLESLMNRDADLTASEKAYTKALLTLIQKFESIAWKETFGDEKSSGEEILDFLLEQHGLTQVKAAEIAGVSKQKMNDFLHGRQALPRAARVKLGQSFKVPAHLFEMESKKAAV